MRLFARRIPFTDAADLASYALRIAHNLHVTLQRGALPTAQLEVADELPGLTDVATTVEQRLALEAAHLEMRTFNPKQLALLDDDPSVTKGRKDSQKEKVPRHRLRNRLRKAANGLLQ